MKESVTHASKDSIKESKDESPKTQKNQDEICTVRFSTGAICLAFDGYYLLLKNFPLKVDLLVRWMVATSTLQAFGSALICR